jgi:hypothetical protein
MIVGKPIVFSLCRFRWNLFLVLCLLTGFVGCQMTLISSYDPEMDKAATALQKKMDAFLTKLETQAGHPQTDYSWNVTFYDDYLVELRSLHLRAGSDPKNEKMAKQVQLMMENLQQLRLAHQAGSLDLSTLQATRTVFNQGWQDIIGMEIAKRRGETSL